MTHSVVFKANQICNATADIDRKAVELAMMLEEEFDRNEYDFFTVEIVVLQTGEVRCLVASEQAFDALEVERVLFPKRRTERQLPMYN